MQNMFTSGLPRRKASRLSTQSSATSETPFDWIRENITGLKCIEFVPGHAHHHPLGPTSRCCCGATLEAHCASVQQAVTAAASTSTSAVANDGAGREEARHLSLVPRSRGSWHVATHTAVMATNAYGIVEFQAGPHPTRAKYARLHYETPGETVLTLLLHEWRIPVPSLVISAIGGLANSSLQSQLQQVVYRGLLRAAKTTVAWVITNGLDVGVTRHVGDALGHEVHIRGSNIVVIGIAPWGCVQNREDLIGFNKTCTYSARGGGLQEAPLNSSHNYFLFADNGTSGRFGGELCLRQRLEQYLAEQPIDMRRYGGVKSRIPVVGVLLEGSVQSFRTVLDLVTGRHPVPVVVCDGSGRAADILAFMHRYAGQDMELPLDLKQRLIGNLCQTFHLQEFQAEGVYSELRQCVKRRHLISVFRMGEGENEEIDITILTAMLRGSKLTPAEQLSLTMAWDRPDIAKSKVFQAYPQWDTAILEHALADALLNDRLEFVRLLINKGLDVQRFLTVARLEKLYIASSDANNQAFHELFAKVLGKRHRVTLARVGHLIELLVGGGYQHNYCEPGGGYGHLVGVDSALRRLQSANSQVSNLNASPRKSYTSTGLEQVSQGATQAGQQQPDDVAQSSSPSTTMPHQHRWQQQQQRHQQHEENYCLFRHPYTELLQWALLTRRYSMARFMVLSGEESIAKALFSVKLLRGILSATVDEDTDGDLALELKTQTQAFEQLAVDLQEHCYRENAEQTKRLLTYELLCFSHHTCLSLAYLCESKSFIGHPCAQAILNDLWYGGLRKGSLVGVKVSLLLIGMAFPPLYPLLAYCLSTRSKFLEFKTKQELARQPQTLQEHLDELEQEDMGTTSSSSSSTSSSSSSSSSSLSTGRHRRRHWLTSTNVQSPKVSPSTVVKVEKQEVEDKGLPGVDLPSSAVAVQDPTKKSKVMGDARDQLATGESPAPTTTSPRPSGAAVHGEEEQRSRLSSSTELINSDPPSSGKCRTSDEQDPAIVQLRGLSSSPATATQRQSSVLITDGETVLEGRENKFCVGVAAPTGQGATAGNQPSHVNSLTSCSNNDTVGSSPGGSGRPLSWRRRIVVFFSAPVTRFYLHVLLYLVFIIFYSGLSIHTLPIRHFSPLECYVYLYIVTFFLDRFREISLSHGTTCWQKLRIHLSSSYWNQYNMFICLLSLVGILLRYLALVYDRLYMWGKNLLIICCAFWQLRFFEFMRMWRFSGAYTYMIFQMLCIMNPMLSLLFLPLVAFGTLRQGIMYPNRTAIDLTGVKGILLKPYFMMYGEVYADEIDPVDWPPESLEAPFFQVVPIAMTIYMMYSMILFTSLVMALFRDVYAEVLEQSELVYNFIRYAVIIDFDSRPLLPPPFIVFSWANMAVHCVCRSRRRRKLRLAAQRDARNEASASGTGLNVGKLRHPGEQRGALLTKWHVEAEQRDLSVGLKLFLNQDEITKLHTFEGECVDDYWRQNRLTEKVISESQEYICNKKLDQLQARMDDVNVRQNQARSLFHGVEARLLRMLAKDTGSGKSY